MKNLLVLFFTICTISVFGQNTDHSVERKGFVFGLGISGGVVSISDSFQEDPFDEAQGGISLPNLKLGWMVNDRLAILATLPGMIYEYKGKDRSFDAFIPTVQYWFKDRWWVNGGIGLAMDFPAFYEVDDFKDEEWNFGCAVSASTGYEIVQRNEFTIDLISKINMGRVFMDNDEYRDGVAFTVGVGFNWY
jgi:hypothetical protein